MSNTVKVDIDWGAIKRQVQQKSISAQVVLDTAIINDTEPFVPFREGTLNSSVNRATMIGSGQIVYDTPYARHLYYGINVRTGRQFHIQNTFHPKATAGWFDVAKSAYLEKWVREVQEAMKR